MRDWWYEVVLEKWPTSSYREQRLNDAVVRSADDPVAAKAVIEELSRGLDRLKAMLDRPSAQTIRSVATGLVTATRLGENVHANVRCSRCGSSVGLLVGQSACPTCAEPIRY